MDTKALAKTLNAEIINDGGAEITCGYAGDLLSFIMGNAPAGCAWFTIMNNVNVCAVATLAEIGAVVLCSGVKPDLKLLEKVITQNITLAATALDVFSACGELYKALSTNNGRVNGKAGNDGV